MGGLKIILTASGIFYFKRSGIAAWAAIIRSLSWMWKLRLPEFRTAREAGSQTTHAIKFSVIKQGGYYTKPAGKKEQQTLWVARTKQQEKIVVDVLEKIHRFALGGYGGATRSVAERRYPTHTIRRRAKRERTENLANSIAARGRAANLLRFPCWLEIQEIAK